MEQVKTGHSYYNKTVLYLPATIREFQCLHATQDITCKAPKIGLGTAVHGIPPFARAKLSVNTPSRPLSPLPHE